MQNLTDTQKAALIFESAVRELVEDLRESMERWTWGVFVPDHDPEKGETPDWNRLNWPLIQSKYEKMYHRLVNSAARLIPLSADLSRYKVVEGEIEE